MKTKTKTVTGPFGIPMAEATKTQLEQVLNDLPDRCGYQRVKAVSDVQLVAGERADISLVSVESVDRQGEVVLAKGMDFTLFKRNPIVTFAHKYDELPVGHAQWIRQVPGGVKAKTKYADKPQDWQGPWLPDACFAMTQQGVLRGKSIGFLATRMRSPTKEEVSRNPSWKNANAVIDKSILLEYAIAPVPVNQDALVEVVSKGFADPKMLARLGLMKKSKAIALLAKALERVTIDPERIASEAVERVLSRYKV